MDKNYIYQSLQQLVINNLDLSKVYIQDLLEMERLNIQEPDWKNPAHIARMIIMATLFFKMPEISKIFPYYFEKHLAFLKDTYPNYFIAPESDKTNAEEDHVFFRKIKSANLTEMESIIMQEIISALNKKNEPILSLNAFKKLKNTLFKIQTSDDMRGLQSLIEVISKFFEISVDIKNTYSLEMIYSKWSDEQIYQIFHSLIEIEEPHEVEIHKIDSSLGYTRFTSACSETQALLDHVFIVEIVASITLDKNFSSKEETAIYLQQSGGLRDISPKLKTAIENIIRNPENVNKEQHVSEYLQILIEDLRSFTLPEINKLSLKANDKKRAIIISPETNLEDALEVNSQLFVRLDILADLFNINNTNDICFGVRSQDGNIELFKLTQNDIILENRKEKSLKVKSVLHLDYGYWNRPAKITIFIAKILRSENSDLINLLQSHLFENPIKFTSKEKYVVLSNQVELLIKPIQ